MNRPISVEIIANANVFIHTFIQAMIETGELKEYAKIEESKMVGDFLSTAESKWCLYCEHHISDHMPKKSDSTSFFYYPKEYLGCCAVEKIYSRTKITAYQIDPQDYKTNRIARKSTL